jgi:hypothetical protein
MDSRLVVPHLIGKMIKYSAITFWRGLKWIGNRISKRDAVVLISLLVFYVCSSGAIHHWEDDYYGDEGNGGGGLTEPNHNFLWFLLSFPMLYLSIRFFGYFEKYKFYRYLHPISVLVSITLLICWFVSMIVVLYYLFYYI